METKIYHIHQFILKVNLPEEIEIYKLQSQIPNIELVKDNFNSLCNIEFDFIENNIHKIVQHNNKIRLYGVWNDNIKTDIPHLLYSILRHYWIENAYYPIHSIMLENSLLIGHSGSGKTSLSLEALKQGIEVYSYDKTLVHFSNQDLKFLAGTNVISVRKEVYEKESAIYSLTEPLSIHEGRIVLSANQPGDQPLIKHPYLFFLADTPLSVNKMTIASSLHELYPFFLDTIKTDVIIGNGAAIFNGNNNSMSKEILLNHLNKWLLRNNSLETLIGRKEDIISYVKENNKGQ